MSHFAASKRHYRQLRSDIKKIRDMLKLTSALREFFREPITLERAREELKRAMESRTERFLEIVRTQVFERSASPYLKLFKLAGCEFSDVRAQIHSHGLEKTLKQLAAQGVYLTADEFKGKKEVLRGTASFWVNPSDFEPLGASPGVTIQTSGTRNQPIRSSVPLEWLHLRACAIAVFLSAHGVFSNAHAMYDAILPGSGGINNLLSYAKLGIATDHWFARKIPVNNWLEGQYHSLMTYLIVLMGKWFGPGFPKPELIDLTDIPRIIDWVSENRREGKACCIACAASNGVRIARAALELGQSLEGVTLNVSGEPLTEGKREIMESAGAAVTCRFAYSAGMTAGYGCANAVHPDEVHVTQHMMALILHPTLNTGDGTPIQPLLGTMLYPSAPAVLINVANGDYGIMDERNCGCALENAGLTLHLHYIRSYEKFATEGMSYFYGDLFELIEHTLPSEFGGGPGDYQLVEEEDETGQTRLTILVHPNIRNLDENRLIARITAAFADGPRGNRFMTGVWKNAGTFQIRRTQPHASPRGKILPLHIRRHQNASAL